MYDASIGGRETGYSHSRLPLRVIDVSKSVRRYYVVVRMLHKKKKTDASFARRTKDTKTKTSSRKLYQT